MAKNVRKIFCRKITKLGKRNTKERSREMDERERQDSQREREIERETHTHTHKERRKRERQRRIKQHYRSLRTPCTRQHIPPI